MNDPRQDPVPEGALAQVRAFIQLFNRFGVTPS